ncbi:MAG: tyrosine-protein phosphatase, partial [Clostridia bacterium]|nr:tyrosine-protein phosphatase [Clostridia bacterium]
MKRIISLLTCIILISGTFASPVLALSRDGNGEFSIVLDDLGENVCLHTDVQLSYLNGPVEDVLRYYQANDEDNSRPKAIKFSWETNGPVSGNYTLLLSRSPDMSDPRVFSTAYKSILINNLSADTRYYWTVSANHEGIVYTSEVSTFTTEDRAPNNFFARGITNLRDCGGWPTLDGGRIKYGMLYRCSALSYKDDAYLGEEGKIVMHDVLGIKTEIDLRQRLESGYYGQTASVIGDDVSYYLCAMDGFYEGESHESIRRVFEILSDEANYPVVFHCAIGTDRTGKIAYLTEALLGASDTDTVRDYLLSVLSDVGATRYAGDAAESYKNDVKSYHGTVLSEKAYNYLHEVIGVPTEQLDKIISILKEYPDEVKKPVSTAEEFAAMDPGGAYYLANDITVSSTYKDEFTGVFDGNGHTVTVSVPMFERFSGKVRDLTIRGEVKAESADLAAFAVSAEGVEAENVKNYANVTLV